MGKTFSIMKKELWSYFATPTALIFLGTYLFISLFTFFWVEKFFSRNIADLRPLFEWMPLLMIFLIATLTMKMWSEERRMGTVEFLLTLPIKTTELVLGKFLACMALVATALFLTLGLAFTAGFLGNVDWGPVFGAYLASLLLASAYTSIGLYISSKTESQIISLILTVIVSFVFYLVGSPVLVDLVGNAPGEMMKLFGTGARFTSISRGVLDLRDIYYYLSISAVFLALNCYSLDSLKWSKEADKPRHGAIHTLLGLVMANLILGNFWLHSVNTARFDMTAQKLYSISETTRDTMSRLEEPMQIIGVFSARTHPLLAPLVPQLRDLLKEYQIAGNGRVKTKFIDPRMDENLEAELKQKYSIDPVSFQLNDRHSASMINSYFNIIVTYGDQHAVLDFSKLIEVKQSGITDIDVKLRNPEYELTRTMLKVMKEFSTTDNVFARLDAPVKFVGYISENIPDSVVGMISDVKKELETYKENSQGKLEIEFHDPSKDEALAQTIATKYGFKPQATSLFSNETFYIYLTVQSGEKVFNLGLPEDLNVESFKTSLDSAIQRLVPGFMKTVGIVAPKAPPMNPMMAQFGGGGPKGKSFKAIEQKLEESYATETVDLSSGKVDHSIDMLMVLAPKELEDKEVFAIDQYLLAGGTVVLATGAVEVNKSNRGFDAVKYPSGLNKWLSHHGVTIPEKLVLDSHNMGFPTIQKRVVRGVTLHEPVIAPYPFFIDGRDSELNEDSMITAGLNQMTMTWASPIIIDKAKMEGLKLTELMHSSKESWTTDNIDINPNKTLHPELGFEVPEKKSRALLAMMTEGRFKSFYAGKDSPLLSAQKAEEAAAEQKPEGEEAKEAATVISSVIDKSPESARLVVLASNEFIADDTLQLASMLNGTQYVNSLQLVENISDWSTADRAMLKIRGRGHFARTLQPMSADSKRNWEIANYLIALFGLLGIYIGYRSLQGRIVNKYKKQVA